MADKIPYEKLLNLLDTKKSGDHDWFLSLLDDDAQKGYEDEHMQAVMQMLRHIRIRPYKIKIQAFFKVFYGIKSAPSLDFYSFV